MKKTLKIKRRYILLLVILLFTFLSACGVVTPSGPTISSFTSSSTSITEGDSVTLSWVTNATTVSIDQGVGSVAVPSGSTTVTPASIGTLAYTLTATNRAGTNTATVTITVNPVMVEHTIIIQPGSEERKDSFVQSKYPGSNFGTATYAMIGNDFGPTIIRTYLQFNLSALPKNISITAAHLMVYQYYYFYPLDFDIAVHRITSIWEENTITWDHQPNYNLLSEDYICVTNDNDDTWLSWDITSLVQDWLEESIPNYGVVLQDTDEDSVYHHIRCWTSD